MQNSRPFRFAQMWSRRIPVVLRMSVRRHKAGRRIAPELPLTAARNKRPSHAARAPLVDETKRPRILHPAVMAVRTQLSLVSFRLHLPSTHSHRLSPGLELRCAAHRAGMFNPGRASCARLPILFSWLSFGGVYSTVPRLSLARRSVPR
jgi:hypothetical protein